MPVVAGGWTTDAAYVAYLDESGLIVQIFKAMLIETIRQRLASIEQGGALSPAEARFAQLQGDFDYYRNIEFIKTEAFFQQYGYYMPSSAISNCLGNQWVNILKKWQP